MDIATARFLLFFWVSQAYFSKHWYGDDTFFPFLMCDLGVVSIICFVGTFNIYYKKKRHLLAIKLYIECFGALMVA